MRARAEHLLRPFAAGTPPSRSTSL